MNEEEQRKYWVAWEEMMADSESRDITPMELDKPLPEKDFAIDRAERNYEHGQYLAQGGVDHPESSGQLVGRGQEVLPLPLQRRSHALHGDQGSSEGLGTV